MGFRNRGEYLNLLDETVNYYSEDTSRRALTYFESGEVDNCIYLTKDGKMCAVGRCLNQNEMDYGTYNRETSVESLIMALTDKVFKEEYQGYNVDFWQDLQNLHDIENNWTKDGLSDKGNQMYDNIKYKIVNDEFTKHK